MNTVEHPAKYSDNLLPIFAELLEGYDKVLDPFAGTGKLRIVRPDAYLLEIEPEWAAINGATVGDALNLAQYWTESFFDATITSPVYGNRMSDHFVDHQTEKNYKRHTYRHCLGRPLHPSNSGQLQWGHKYQTFHARVWSQVRIVLRPGGRFILNISDHIRNKQVVPVTQWHKGMLEALGFEYDDFNSYDVFTPRQKHGANGSLRVECESILTFINQK